MGNCLGNSKNISAIFDLKGSLQGRLTKPHPEYGFKPSTTLKDLNLIQLNKKRKWLNFD
jgi:hypothetical protein